TSTRKNEGNAEYQETSARMLELAQRQPGYLGVESYRNPDGTGVTISYWESREAIAAWKEQKEHRRAQERGKREWYESYTTRLVRVEGEIRFPPSEDGP